MVSVLWLRRIMVLVALVAGITGLAARKVAADPLNEESSLKFAPADASFYVSCMRLGEVFDRVADSNAVAKLQSLPAVQMGIMAANMQWQNPPNPQVAMLKQMWEAPKNQELVDVLKDALSQEVFVYGDSQVGATLALLNDINSAVTAGQMEALSAGEFQNIQTYQLRKVLEVLDERGEELKVPMILKGMQLSDTQAALEQLDRLETLVNTALEEQPEIRSGLSREQIGDGEFLTLKLEGTMIPWSEVMEDAQENSDVDPQLMQQLVDKLSGLEATISVGVRNEYLLASIGPDNSHLNTLGQGELLYERDEMAPVREAADKPLTGVSYAGQELLGQLSSINRQMDQLLAMVKQFAPMLLMTAPGLQEELIADVEKAAEYVKDQVPEPGSYSGYSFMTPEGYESLSYSWSSESALDASQNLSIVKNVGGNPIAFYAARGKSDPEDFEALATFVSRLGYYGEQLALEQLSDQQGDAYEKLKGDLLPLIEQFGQVTRDNLVPAFADSQSALVLDAQSKSESWYEAMPPTETELPMLELGLVMGVSDANLVEKAFAEYFDIAQEALDKLHEASTGELRDTFPQPIPAIELAKPATEQVEGGTVYYYALPEQTGLDKQLAPNAGLSETVLVSSLFPRFTARLLDDTPLEATGPLANTDRPLGAAFKLDFASLLDAISPWLDYAMGLSGQVSTQAQPAQAFGQAQPPGEAAEGDMPMNMNPAANLAGQADQVIEILQCFRGVVGVTYQEGEAMVTHSQWHFEDLQP
ncbi:MAG: hypothetical protein ACODAD_07925 [Planctomycetota bacterium]